MANLTTTKYKFGASCNCICTSLVGEYDIGDPGMLSGLDFVGDNVTDVVKAMMEYLTSEMHQDLTLNLHHSLVGWDSNVGGTVIGVIQSLNYDIAVIINQPCVPTIVT